ncbi:hypothetical protein [Flavobacterium lacisediminis]|uniref:Peptidylprolyl isomerase n=1 Tax=Flavobacterium lacisediminis TaxID=2989705 RepID=A0ABT3EG25_9FLAO|nr:hypothetical protein [Flavobacterium lacisediminis]MCW1147384.1 hypothetical protein [Flavobacterium lacisediminis]
MKKIIFSLLLFFAFSTVSFAQEKKSGEPKMLAKLELNEFTKEIPLETNLENGLYNLLVYKHEMLAKATSDKEKAEVYEIIKNKLSASLSTDQLKKLMNNKNLYENIIQ